MTAYDLIAGFAQGFLSGAANQLLLNAQAPRPATIDQLCQPLGWSVNERDGDTAVIHFTDPMGGVRKVSIRPQESDLALFIVSSRAALSTLPLGVAAYLLERNVHVDYGTWATATGSGRVVIAFICRANLTMLDSEGFRNICSTMVLEAQDFDSRLQGVELRA